MSSVTLFSCERFGDRFDFISTSCVCEEVVGVVGGGGTVPEWLRLQTDDHLLVTAACSGPLRVGIFHVTSLSS